MHSLPCVNSGVEQGHKYTQLIILGKFKVGEGSILLVLIRQFITDG